MGKHLQKRLHQHGGSKALDLPSSFVKKLSNDYVKIEERENCLIIHPECELTSMESDPHFAHFIECLLMDAMANPAKLKDAKEIWDAEWDDLLKGVSEDEE